MITIKDKNSTYVQLEVTTEEDFHKVFDFFSVKIPSAEFMPSVKMGFSDGRQKFITPKGELPFGLKDKLIVFCKNNNITVVDETTKPTEEITYENFIRFVELLDLQFKPYKHQLEGAFQIINHKRKIILSATGSGKSLTIYIVLRYMLAKGQKSMLIVPTIDLVNQMYSDFEEYFTANFKAVQGKITTEKDYLIQSTLNQDIDKIYHQRTLTKCNAIADNFCKIFGGQDKHTNHLIKISTYQSLSLSNNRVDPEYFDDVKCLIIDETHKASSDSIQNILKVSTQATWKSGLTGSLSDDIISNLTIEGLLGSVTRVVSMREMIDLGLATEIVIKPIFIQYPPEIVKAVKKMTYQEEDKFLRNLPERARFLAKLMSSFKDKNTMLIYRNIDCAELILKELINVIAPEETFNIKNYRKQNDLKVYYSQGDTKSAERNNFRGYLESEKGCKLLGTTSIIATGLNIKSLDITIFESIGKSSTLTIQGLGRGARLHNSKKQSVVYDIVDDCRHYSKSGKAYPNYKFEHWMERLEIYYSEEYLVDEPVNIKLKLDLSTDIL